MMGESIAEVAAGLSGHDADMIAGAWQGSSGRWYVDGRCKHLYALDICRLTGVLTTRGEALRNHLISQGADHDR